jgi:hypothetical protein
VFAPRANPSSLSLELRVYRSNPAKVSRASPPKAPLGNGGGVALEECTPVATSRHDNVRGSRHLVKTLVWTSDRLPEVDAVSLNNLQPKKEELPYPNSVRIEYISLCA